MFDFDLVVEPDSQALWTAAPVTITKYERARAIGTRAAQIGNNMAAMCDVRGMHDPLAMATKEFNEGKCPLYARRYMPTHTSENPNYIDYAVKSMRVGP